MTGIEAAVIGPIWEAVKGGFCFCCARAEYFDDLEVQLESYKRKISQLKAKKDYVETRIKHEKTAQMQPLYEVTDWLKRVNSLQKGAEKIIKEAEEETHKKALRFFCPKHCCSYNRVGNKVSENVKEVTKLIDEGNNFNAFVEKRLVDLVDEMPVPEIVGLESMVKKICRMIEDPSVRIIGLHGMGGVGKTTLLKKMYNELCYRDCVVIWVEKPQVKAAQEAISKTFEIQQQEFIERAIWNSLRRVKFVLMLDNLGEEWDHHLLEEVGVPLNDNGNGSKIIITTRSEKVCDAMKATKIKLDCLPKETAVKLFKLHVGEATLKANWEISELAEDIADACGGFPLLLTTTARAMAGKKNVNVWKRERENLKNQLAKVTNVEDHVFPVLKVNYDTLSNNTLKKCFLYFSLFSEGDNIKKKEVIELWKAEGYLDEFNEDTIFNDARANGENILESLMDVSLLERGKSSNFVKMHDVIREMTLWLACEKGKAEDKVLVRKKALDFSKWINAEKISLQDLSIKSLPQSPSCHFLTTLLIRATNLERLPSEFFQSMLALRVLSLSDNECLVELPVGIGNLSNLHYLNLSGTSIQILPLEVQNLKKLQTLILDRECLQLIIPRGVISGLSSLLAFSMFDQVHSLHDSDSEVKLLEELECLEHITEIEIILSIASFVEKVLNTDKLRKYIKQLQLVQQRDVQKLSLTSMEHLERLELLKCSSLTEVEIEVEHEGKSYNVPNYLLRRQECFPNLGYVRICDCPIKNVTCLVYVKNLRSLKLIDCSEIVEVISEDFGHNVFKYLVDLSLKGLPKLKSIYCHALEFPSLSKLVVYDCAELQSLPLDSHSAKNLKQIKGSRNWWNNLQWNEISIEQAFSQKLQDTPTDPVSELLKAYKAYNPHLTPYYYVHTGEEDNKSCVIQ